MEKNFGEDVKKIFLAGVGAIATTVEKSKELIDELAKKGEITVEQGKALNEELKRKCKDKMDEVKEGIKVTIINDVTVDSIKDKVASMSKEDLQAVKEAIDEALKATDGEEKQ